MTEEYAYMISKFISDDEYHAFQREADRWRKGTKKCARPGLYYKKGGNLNVWLEEITKFLSQTFNGTISSNVLKELIIDRELSELVEKQFYVKTETFGENSEGNEQMALRRFRREEEYAVHLLNEMLTQFGIDEAVHKSHIQLRGTETLQEYLNTREKSEPELSVYRIKPLEKLYLIRKACNNVHGTEPTTATHSTIQWLNGADLFGELKLRNNDFKLEDLLECIVTCRKADYKILGQTVMVNQASFLKTIYRLKGVYEPIALQIILEHATAVHNIAKHEGKNIDLMAFKEKVARHNLGILARNVKMLKGDFEIGNRFPIVFIENKSKRKRGLEDNKLAQRLSNGSVKNKIKKLKNGM